jgi:hypothetical protein
MSFPAVDVAPFLLSGKPKVWSQNIPSRQTHRCVILLLFMPSSVDSARTKLPVSCFFRLSHSSADGPRCNTSGRVGAMDVQGIAKSCEVEACDFKQYSTVVLAFLMEIGCRGGASVGTANKQKHTKTIEGKTHQQELNYLEGKTHFCIVAQLQPVQKPILQEHHFLIAQGCSELIICDEIICRFKGETLQQ